jgi:hypothetical protein
MTTNIEMFGLATAQTVMGVLHENVVDFLAEDRPF